jgi:hypothetical protein
LQAGLRRLRRHGNNPFTKRSEDETPGASANKEFVPFPQKIFRN